MYEYKLLAVLKIIDGDTYDLTLDVGFNMSIRLRVGLAGYDTPEILANSDNERSKAAEAAVAAQNWFQNHEQITVRTLKTDSFGRWLGTIKSDTSDLGVYLADLKLAAPYPQKWSDIYGAKRNHDD